MTATTVAGRPVPAPPPGGGLDLARLYRDHHRDVFRFLYGRCGSTALAEDLTQDTFERVARWVKSHRWQERGSRPLSLLLTVARNLLLNHQKSYRHRREVPWAEFDTPATRAGVWSAAELSVDEQVCDRWQQAGWWRVLAEAAATVLSEQQRRVLHLAFVEDLPDRDIARRLGLHPMAVKGCRYRALQRLRRSPTVAALASRRPGR